MGFTSFIRTCKRCKRYFRTHAKTGRYCDKCKLPIGAGAKEWHDAQRNLKATVPDVSSTKSGINSVPFIYK